MLKDPGLIRRQLKKFFMQDRFKLLAVALGENRVKREVDLSEHLHTGLGGLAEAFYIATTIRELIKAVEVCRELKIDFFIVGAGSKMAFAKDGVKGLVIKNRSANIKISGVKGKVSPNGIGIEQAFIEVDSGVSLGKLAEFANSQNLSGLEIFRQKIGTVGGTLYYNPDLKDKSTQVKVIESLGKLKIKHTNLLLKEDIILSVTFNLKAKKK